MWLLFFFESRLVEIDVEAPCPMVDGSQVNLDNWTQASLGVGIRSVTIIKDGLLSHVLTKCGMKCPRCVMLHFLCQVFTSDTVLPLVLSFMRAGWHLVFSRPAKMLNVLM